MPDPSPAMIQRLNWSAFGANAGELYERYMVPAIFAPWAEDLVRNGQCQPGDRVLDVACGTGIVARGAAQRVGPSGRVVGLDLSPGMLAEARRAAGGIPIEWWEGSALALPFPNASFDVVLCQQGVQFFPDRVAGLGEMRRVLAPEGRLAISVFRASAGHFALAEGLEPVLGPAAWSVCEPFTLSDAGELHAITRDAEFRNIHVRLGVRAARFADPDSFMMFLMASRLAAAMSTLTDRERDAVVDRARTALKPYTGPAGLVFPMEAHVLTALAS